MKDAIIILLAISLALIKLFRWVSIKTKQDVALYNARYASECELLELKKEEIRRRIEKNR